MRSIYLSVCLCLFVIITQAQVNINAPWTWVNGESRIPMRPVTGIKNVASATNLPGGRKHSASWQTADGKVWVFGGYGYAGNNIGYLNDLWRYDPSLNQWTWINGDNAVNIAAVYGTQGVADNNNRPGARRGSVAWIDADGNLCLLGGDGYGSAATGRLNDLWRYNVVTNQWTWVSGSSSLNAIGIYGTQGTANVTNWPGARNGANLWKDDSNNIWLFGGDGYANSSTLGRLNDLWKYNVVTNQWSWMNGSNAINASSGPGGPGSRNGGNMGWKDNSGNLYIFGGISAGGILGPEGNQNTSVSFVSLNDFWRYNISTNQWMLLSPGAALRPEPRFHSVTFNDASGNLWLFGGNSWVATGDIDYNDLWKYDLTTGLWAKIKGDVTGYNSYGIYGVKGIADANNNQGGRGGNIGWTDNTGKLWMFGGDFFEGSTTTFRNDVWQYNPATNIQTWISGDTAATVMPIYGQQEIPDAANRPGERRGSGGWADNTGNLWLMGGNTEMVADEVGPHYRNDLWRYNIASGQWTWMKGGQGFFQTGTYGTRGVADPNNKPGARESMSTWTDASNNLWLFGGTGFVFSGQFNDLWKYNTATNQWTWMHGKNGFNLASHDGVYGTKGVYNSANKPPARRSAATWVDNDGNLLLFGGRFNTEYENDLWRYNTTTNQWAWISGDNTSNQAGIYGVKGVSSATNKPGARMDVAGTWKDNAGNIWLFGGNTSTSYLNDVWKYDITSGQWTWMHGSSAGNATGVYGVRGTADDANQPGGRTRSLSWTDATGNFWLMGGSGYDAAGNLGSLNDMWMYNPLNNKWTWVKGDQTIGAIGIYGDKGVSDVSNKPGARYGATGFKDGSGNFWLYGGYGFAEMGESRLSELWKISSPSLGTLPVRLLEFKGRFVNDNGMLNWKTENEVNLSGYIVERSIDRKNYVPVGTVAAMNTSGGHQYNFNDPNISSLGATVVYYRLKQKDLDGKSTYSNIIALTIDKSLLVMLYPNPVIKTANVTITISRAETVNVKVINGAGAVVKQLQWKLTSGSTSETLDLSVLSKGSYILDISGETIMKRISFVKQ